MREILKVKDEHFLRLNFPLKIALNFFPITFLTSTVNKYVK